MKTAYFGISKSNRVSFDNEIKVYPNPTSDKVYISMGKELISGEEVVVYDLFGKRSSVEVIPSGSHQMVIDLSRMESGIYFIKIINGDELEVFRILKQ